MYFSTTAAAIVSALTLAPAARSRAPGARDRPDDHGHPGGTPRHPQSRRRSAGAHLGQGHPARAGPPRRAQARQHRRDRRRRNDQRVRSGGFGRLRHHGARVDAGKVEGTYNFISVEGAQAEVSAENVRGDIVIKGGSGLVTARTIEGLIIVEGRAAGSTSTPSRGYPRDRRQRRHRRGTTNGDIALARIESASVEVTTVNGDVTYEGTLADRGNYHFTSHNGDLVMTLPDTVNATFTVRSYQGTSTPPCRSRGRPGGRAPGPAERLHPWNRQRAGGDGIVRRRHQAAPAGEPGCSQGQGQVTASRPSPLRPARRPLSAPAPRGCHPSAVRRCSRPDDRSSSARVGELLDVLPAVGVRDHELVIRTIGLMADLVAQTVMLTLKEPDHVAAISQSPRVYRSGFKTRPEEAFRNVKSPVASCQ